jgi:hypothetical protein
LAFLPEGANSVGDGAVAGLIERRVKQQMPPPTTKAVNKAVCTPSQGVMVANWLTRPSIMGRLLNVLLILLKISAKSLKNIGDAIMRALVCPRARPSVPFDLGTGN